MAKANHTIELKVNTTAYMRSNMGSSNPNRDFDVAWLNNLDADSQYDVIRTITAVFAKCLPEQSKEDWEKHMSTVGALKDTEAYKSLSRSMDKWVALRDKHDLKGKTNGKQLVWTRIGKAFIPVIKTTFSENYKKPDDLPLDLKYSKLFWSGATPDEIGGFLAVIAKVMNLILTKTSDMGLKREPNWDLRKPEDILKDANELGYHPKFNIFQSELLKRTTMLPYLYFVNPSRDDNAAIITHIAEFEQHLINQNLIKVGDPDEITLAEQQKRILRWANNILHYQKVLLNGERGAGPKNSADFLNKLDKEFGRIYANDVDHKSINKRYDEIFTEVRKRGEKSEANVKEVKEEDNEKDKEKDAKKAIHPMAPGQGK